MDERSSTCLMAIDKAAVIQWRLLAGRHHLQSDTEVAWFLLRHYETPQPTTVCSTCHGPLTLFCAKCSMQSSQTCGSVVPHAPIPHSGEMHIKGEDFMDAEERLRSGEPSSQAASSTKSFDVGVTGKANCERDPVPLTAGSDDEADCASPSPTGQSVRRLRRTKRKSRITSEVLFEDKTNASSQGKDMLFSCSKCDASFLSLKYLNTHMLSHSGETVYPCDQCPSVFRAPRNLKNHLATHTGNERYRCYACGAAFTWYSSWKRHTQDRCFGGTLLTKGVSGLSEEVLQENAKDHKTAHSPESAQQEKTKGSEPDPTMKHTSEQQEKTKQYKIGDGSQLSPNSKPTDELVSAEAHQTCPKCQATFSNSKHFNTHMLSHKGKKVYPCDKCSAVYKNPRGLKDHARSHTGKGLYRCEKCGAGFIWRSSLQYHKKQCDESSKTVCDVCGVDCHSVAKLKTHVNTHLKEYKCEDCGEFFRIKIDLEKHMIRKHTLPKKHVCSVCGIAYGYKNSLILHMRTHTGERPHQCEQCGASFALPSCLRNHVRLHSEEKRYVCKVCDAAFKQPGGLQAHMATHSDEKPFTCSVCGRSFARSVYLKNHMLSHTGVKSFVCKVCNQSFFRSTELKTHTYKHTGERPFVCKECGKSFTKNFFLTKHKRVHTGEKPYVCQECGTAFSSWSSCRRHQKTHKSCPSQTIKTLL